VRVVLATRNQGKIREFADTLSELRWEITALPESVPPVTEDGMTFEENARKKAEAVANLLNLPVLADDSGLQVDALEGRPGVFSARYAGEQASDEANNRKLLHELTGVPADKRTARFVCALAYAKPGEPTVMVRGECEGVILDELKGNDGFGYDPLFYVPEAEKTFGELALTEKNRISHRARAIQTLLKVLSAEDRA
jgi:XTP/dITP diphosphohydrolase